MLGRLLGHLRYERRSTNQAAGGDSYWQDFANSRSTPVNARTAQSVSAVYGCVAAISETIASLPLITYRREGEDRLPATDYPLYGVLHDIANSVQSALEFREWMMASVLLRGNAYARIERGWDGVVRELIPMHPDRINVCRLGNKLVYEYTTRDGVVHRLLGDEVFHLRHRAGDDWALGVSPIQAAREVIELSIAERDHGNSTFRNGAKLSGILKFPQKLKPEQRLALKASWDSQYSGGANNGKTAVLEEGVEYQTVSMTLEDAEWISARQFSVEEVCRLFRTPPTIVGDLRHGNYSNAVEMNRQFVTLTLRRHLVMWEQSIAKQLMTPAARRIYFAEHSVEGLLRGDSTTRASFYASGIEAGWLLPSEARRLENLPVLDEVDYARPDQDPSSTEVEGET